MLGGLAARPLSASWYRRRLATPIALPAPCCSSLLLWFTCNSHAWQHANQNQVMFVLLHSHLWRILPPECILGALGNSSTSSLYVVVVVVAIVAVVAALVALGDAQISLSDIFKWPLAHEQIWETSGKSARNFWICSFSFLFFFFCAYICQRYEDTLAFVAHLLSAMDHLALLLLNWIEEELAMEQGGFSAATFGSPNIYSFNTQSCKRKISIFNAHFHFQFVSACQVGDKCA